MPAPVLYPCNIDSLRRTARSGFGFTAKAIHRCLGRVCHRRHFDFRERWRSPVGEAGGPLHRFPWRSAAAGCAGSNGFGTIPTQHCRSLALRRMARHWLRLESTGFVSGIQPPESLSGDFDFRADWSFGIAFTPDGIATAGTNRGGEEDAQVTIRLLDPATGACPPYSRDGGPGCRPLSCLFRGWAATRIPT